MHRAGWSGPVTGEKRMKIRFHIRLYLKIGRKLHLSFKMIF